MPLMPLLPQGRSRPGANPDTVDMSVLNAFADASGGKAWLLSGSWSGNRGNEIQNALDEIAAELRNQYSIGYTPANRARDGKLRKIKVQLVDNNGAPLIVQDQKGKKVKYVIYAREGYMGPKPGVSD